jgi:FAD/FMN-containing dehydrogenase
VKDNYGDPIKVEVDYDEIFLTVTDTSGVFTSESDAALTPKTARKLAKALKRAAKQVEGKVL